MLLYSTSSNRNTRISQEILSIISAIAVLLSPLLFRGEFNHQLFMLVGNVFYSLSLQLRHIAMYILVDINLDPVRNFDLDPIGELELRKCNYLAPKAK